MKLSRNDLLVWGYILLLTAALGVSLFAATPYPMDDHFFYQAFVETLAGGKLDLTIPGFHGSDFFAVPWYLLTQSKTAQIEVLMFVAVLLPLFGYGAGKALYGSSWHGVMLASIAALMPFISFVGLRGWTGPAYFSLMFLAIITAKHAPRWTGLPFGLAMLTKPFAVALFPLLMVLSPKAPSLFRRTRWILAGFLIVLLYLVIQYLQAGRIIIGTHEELSVIQVLGMWETPVRFVLNLAHGIQMLFSVHNYYFPDPALTGPGNLIHTSPVLMFLGIFALLAPATFFPKKGMSQALGLGFVIAFAMAALMDHMDHYYMEAGVLLLILASLPVLKKYPLWIPITLATLHFQWLYFYLQFRANFSLTPVFFLTPLLVDAALLLWVLFYRKEVRTLCKNMLFARS
ncbi:hypothetical protein A3D88_01650 [Candidatus Peribacteria bacterium RIFCSPHIGHO2_02_FULL_52_16]|nr:MAG: hypothetical protein A2706_03890 [Candidatus Peribacteria bacterium RIFCSPHIGHO2_01_FULL_51_35]OGJ61024.1 MAG: hypothetical protein A3D88_01650 [Candidatus Peribacteria bacterium RIFCSPHIGHO2_02_FULL_52_16]